MKRFGLGLLALFGTLVVLAFGILLGGFLWVRGSLPPLDGSRTVQGLTAPVVLERDSLGVAIIRAEHWNDAHLATGLAHGQDRFFQMDLARRFVAGELAELVGPDALDTDRTMRRRGYREAARLHLAALPPFRRVALDHYVAGVNEGLASLGRRPPEYLLLRSRPAPWTAEDSFLVYLSLYHTLATHHEDEIHLRALFRHLPTAVAEFLTPEVSRFDQVVPGLEGPSGDPTGGYRPLAIPPPWVFSLAEVDDPLPDARRALRIYGDMDGPVPGGSNAWATGTDDGTPALLAGDPHLPLQVPGPWYRAEFHTPFGEARGVTFPGLPGMFLGMTEHLAWAPTAAQVDQTDLVELGELNLDTLPLQRLVDTLHVRGAPSETMERLVSPWGPVIHQTGDSTFLALRSPALAPGGLGLDYLDVLHARSVAQGIEVVRAMSGPALGIVLGDAQGHTAWIVGGSLPAREGTDGRRPAAADAGEAQWRGPRPEAERPVVVDSAGGFLFTANQRFASLEQSRSFSGRWMSPARAYRLDALLSDPGGALPDESLHYRHQLDTRSPEHEVVRGFLLELLEGETDPELVLLREQAEEWDGTARADSPDFRSLEAAGRALREAALAPTLALVLREEPDFMYRWPLAHEPAFRILEERPPGFLPPGEEGWEPYLLRTLRRVARELYGELSLAGGFDGAFQPDWGSVNRARISHPFSAVQPALSRFLDMPSDPLPGWLGTVRAQAPAYGQSLRFVGRPGRPESGILDLPGGQSGHLLSPWYGAGHLAWVEARATPLAAGPPLHRLTLEPGSR